ncbi:hypothetical protein [Actinocorallia longicatena]|uniref:ABC transporter permease n=1 Tax=Actinocorallia longicatena TaxID=111803 RepID=A0ABP6QIG3_9ACTN
MNRLVRAERLRLASHRSTWGSLLLCTVLGLGMAAIVGTTPAEDGPIEMPDVLLGIALCQTVLLVLSVLSVTGEYRAGTVRLAFQAVPRRWPVLAAKALVMGALSAAAGFVLATASVLLVRLVAAEGTAPALDTATWRQILVVPPVFALTAVIGVCVGALCRNSAAAVSVALVWSLAAESLLALVPGPGAALSRWAPFTVLTSLIDPATTSSVPGGPPGSLLYAALLTAALLTAAAALLRHRDAA